MASHRSVVLRDALLSAGAWIALLLYIIGCGPSWSPDGEKVLFLYKDAGTGHDAVALFERATGETQRLFSGPRNLYGAQWTKDGTSAIINAGGIGSGEVHIVPTAAPGSGRSVSLVDGADFSLVPIPEVSGHIYFGGKAIARVSLASGRLDTRALDEGDEPVALYDGGDRILYGRELERCIEYGTLDPNTLALEPRFSVDRELLDRQHLDGLWFVAVEPSSTRVAVTGNGPGDDIVLVYRGARLETIVKPRIPSPSYELGNITWARDGRHLYAAVLMPWADATRTQVAVAEIAIEDGRTRLTPVTWIEADFDAYDGESASGYLQIALSPDGRSIAVSTASAGYDLEPENRALFIVDVGDPERPVTRVAPPR